MSTNEQIAVADYERLQGELLDVREGLTVVKQKLRAARMAYHRTGRRMPPAEDDALVPQEQALVVTLQRLQHVSSIRPKRLHSHSLRSLTRITPTRSGVNQPDA